MGSARGLQAEVGLEDKVEVTARPVGQSTGKWRGPLSGAARKVGPGPEEKVEVTARPAGEAAEGRAAGEGANALTMHLENT